MQALRSLFSGSVSDKRVSSAPAPTALPTALSAAQLQQVSGGLPRVSNAPIVVESPLPRVS